MPGTCQGLNLVPQMPTLKPYISSTSGRDVFGHGAFKEAMRVKGSQRVRTEFCRTCVLLRKGEQSTATHRRGTLRRQREKVATYRPRTEASEGTKLADTLGLPVARTVAHNLLLPMPVSPSYGLWQP